MQEDITRFWSYVDKSGDCWLWTGWKKNGRYGTFSLHGKHIQAHRMSWQLSHGDIPEGMCVLHKCDVPACVNPDHLFLGTHTDNMRDMISKDRRVFAPPKGDRHWRSVLTASKVREIRRRVELGEYQEDVARSLGVSGGTVNDVVAGRTWSHVA